MTSLASPHSVVQHNSCGVVTALLRRTSSVCKGELAPSEINSITYNSGPDGHEVGHIFTGKLKPSVPTPSPALASLVAALVNIAHLRVTEQEQSASLTQHRGHQPRRHDATRNAYRRPEEWEKSELSKSKTETRVSFLSETRAQWVRVFTKGPSLNPGTHIKDCHELIIPAPWGLLTKRSSKFSAEYGRDFQSGMNA